MAVTINFMGATTALQKLGLGATWFDALDGCNAAVVLTAKKFEFTTATHAVSVQIDLDDLHGLSQGSLSVAAKIKIVARLQDGIAVLVTLTNGVQPVKLPAGVTYTTQTPVPEMKASPGSAPKPTIKVGVKPPVTDKVASPPAGAAGPGVTALFPTFDLTKLTTAPLVKLRDATQMYQPVAGTSPNSRYYLVAANADLRVAARYSGGTLSVRVEGPHWTKHASAVKDVGFTNVGASKDYASVHLAVGSDVLLASKTLGAVLAGFGIEMQTPIPNLKLLKGV